jgi:hypothetical protein
VASAATASFSCYPKPPALAGGAFTYLYILCYYGHVHIQSDTLENVLNKKS